MIAKHNQKGGNDSTNIQAENMTITLGIDEKRAREIYHEMNLQVRKDYSLEALDIANKRITEFENKLMPKMEEVDGALEAFTDPSFQLLLVEAQKTAASTERPADYELLSELLIHRFKKGANRFTRAGISRAVEIVDEIDDDALLGLTVLHAVSNFMPVSGDIHNGLNVLNNLFGKLFYGNLLEREKVVIKDGEEIELKPGDWDQEEYYFLLKEHNHPHFGKSIFLVLQSGIKSAIIDSVYKRKLKALEDKVRETSTESINFNIKIYNFMNVVQKYGQKQLKKIEIFYNQNSNFSTKAKIEEKLNNVFLEYKLEVSKFSHKFKSIFDIFNEIDFEDVSEINYEIETRKGSKQKLKWSKEENLLNLQARADITDKIEKTDKNFESIYTIFEETFKEVVGE